MNVQLTPNLSVTTVHPLAHEHQPVLVVDGGIRLADGWPDAFGPADIIQIFNRTAPAAYWVYFYGKNLTGTERELVAEYLQQWREGPQLGSGTQP
jgi:hypothetical protein